MDTKIERQPTCLSSLTVVAPLSVRTVQCTVCGGCVICEQI